MSNRNLTDIDFSVAEKLAGAFKTTKEGPEARPTSDILQRAMTDQAQQGMNRKQRRAAFKQRVRRGVSHQNLPRSKRKFLSTGVTERAMRVVMGRQKQEEMLLRAFL